MGDWNFCIRSEPNHPVKSFLESQGFVEVNQLLQQTPLPTHLRGRTIDHAWFKGSLKTITIQSLSVRSCVYSDHEKIEVVIKTESRQKNLKNWTQDGQELKNHPGNNLTAQILEDELSVTGDIPKKIKSSEELGSYGTDLVSKGQRKISDMGEANSTKDVVLTGTNFTCQICSKSYKVFHQLKAHYQKNHNQNLQQGCLKCGETFEKMSMFNNHKCKHGRK